MRVWIVLYSYRYEDPMIAGVFASLEEAKAYLKGPEGRCSHLYLYSEEGEEVEGFAKS
jgi:hypothetical protein